MKTDTHSPDTAMRTCVNLCCYGGPGLSSAIEQTEDKEGVVAQAIYNTSTVFDDLVIFDRCHFVIGEFSELIGLAFLTRGHLAHLLKTRAITLYRLSQPPVFFRPGIDETVDAEGFFLPAVFADMEGKEKPKKDSEKEFDEVLGSVQIPGVTDVLVQAKTLILDSVEELSVSYQDIGRSTLNDVRAWSNQSVHANGIHDAIGSANEIARLLGSVMADLGLKFIFPSSYSTFIGNENNPLLQVFENQFLFNLAAEITQRVDASDYHIASETCAAIKLASISQQFQETSHESLLKKQLERNPLRLIELNGMPHPGGYLVKHIDKCGEFLDLIFSKNANEFRSWYHSHADKPDEVEKAYIQLLSERGFTERGPARVIRYLISTGGGLLPGIGLVAGPVLSALDMFFLDRVLSPKRPKLFIEQMKSILTPIKAFTT
jgi:hypothetical protein